LAVGRFHSADPQASFTFVNGYVDSFSTAAKSSIPDYALPTLRALGLSTAARTPLKIAAPISAREVAKRARNLDTDTSVMLPFVAEAEDGAKALSKGAEDQVERPKRSRPSASSPFRPAESPETLVRWERPDHRNLDLERQAVRPILEAFLAKNVDLFAVSREDLRTSIGEISYQVGAYFRKAAFEQNYSHDEKLLYGRTLVHFDVNWNVIGISRMLITPSKLNVPRDGRSHIDKERSLAIAAKAFPDCANARASVLSAERSVDAIRRLHVWNIEHASDDGNCHWRTIVNAVDGAVVNVSDLTDRAFNDARVNRWLYSGGNLFSPNQVISAGVYTRNDRRLEHDFFYMVNDHRCDGAAETACTETPHASQWCSKAHGTDDGSSTIRATRRTDRDFSSYFPGGASETFAEANAYYWARSFAQWLKPSLDALGVLPSSAADYPRVLMIADACRAGSVHTSAYKVTTEDNKGEGTNVIRLAHRNPAGNSNHNAACEAGGCFDNPSNIAHEMDHFFLKRYYDVDSDLDCGAGNQLKFTHEGIMGTAVPQAYWHAYYGVGYSPSNTNMLYFSHSDTGRVHTSSTNNMTIASNLCTATTGDAYKAGRVVGQALWEFYHGKKVIGSTVGGTWYPSDDTGFNVLVYWAADLQAGSTYKDRYEFANRVMEILDQHSNWSSDGKLDYCDIFAEHGLADFIDPAYCN